MSSLCLWKPNPSHAKKSNLTRFQGTLASLPPTHHPDFHEWSVKNPALFWDHVWNFCQVIGDKGYTHTLHDPYDAYVIVHADAIQKAKFFPNASLNFAENLLRRRDDATAIVAIREDGVRQTLSFCDVYTQTQKLRYFYQRISLSTPVACYLPNIPQAIIGMLATAAEGALYSTCSPDFGVPALIDRFGQIQPDVLYMCDGYMYNGKTFDVLPRIFDIVNGIPSIKHVIMVPVTRGPSDAAFSKLSHELRAHTPHVTLHMWDDIQNITDYEHDKPFTHFPFDHPLYIAYSSGTTGIPKCIVHGAGGTLLQHMKEHQLHCNIKKNDVMFYFTTCSWMMWHWLASGLSSEATLVVYDGSPTYPNMDRLLQLACDEHVTLFGTSAKYLDTLSQKGVSLHKEGQDLNDALPHLRIITSTGSPLLPASFDYVYTHIKHDVCLASISGGTDILSCFVLGNTNLPVYRGEIQTAGLGLDVDVVDEHGHRVGDHVQGELVCRSPFPSRPICFWNDQDDARYTQTYYTRFKNMWHHGDFIEKTEHHGFIIHGRSDATLNPAGVRIGTAELYRQLNHFSYIDDALAIGQSYAGDERIILFLTLRDEKILDAASVRAIKEHIRDQTTPRHVPAHILHVPEMPRTHNHKMAEMAVKKIMNGQKIENTGAIANPQSLKAFEDWFIKLKDEGV